MDQYTVLFNTLAEIAGIFVGFGALISVTGRDEIEAAELGRIRTVVTIGLTAVVAALVPTALAGYGISGRNLWFISSLVFFVLLQVVNILSLRRPENRALLVSQWRTNPISSTFFFLLLEFPLHVLLVLALLGVFPDLEPAFYTTVLVLHIFQAAFVLAQMVYSHASRPSA